MTLFKLMTNTIRFLLAGALSVLSVHGQSPVDIDSQSRPNVILMMADDLANEDLSCYGGKRIQTPRIDQLATQGLRLTSYYAGNPVCSPSRMALLSGSYPSRLGWRWGVLGYGFPPETGMASEVYTMAEAFRDAGYRTAMSGKWHLGEGNLSPQNQGFESAYYIHMSNNQNRDMYRDGRLVQEDWDNRRLTETFAEEAIRVVEESNETPFFLYIPWSAPHFPADPHPDWFGASGEDRSAKYSDVVDELDDRVGQILDALEEEGKAENTIVIFTSDNGRQPGQQGPDDQPPFRGHKWQSLEGGTRVPLIIRYPGAIPAGEKFPELVAAIDLFPTLATACGIVIPKARMPQKLDGVDAWEALRGVGSEPAREELLFWHGKGEATAIRQGAWKLYFNRGAQSPADPELRGGPALYQLKADPLETENLAKERPEIVAALLDRAKELLTEVYQNQIPLGTWSEENAPAAPLQAKDVWGPWLESSDSD